MTQYTYEYIPEPIQIMLYFPKVCSVDLEWTLHTAGVGIELAAVKSYLLVYKGSLHMMTTSLLYAMQQL